MKKIFLFSFFLLFLLIGCSSKNNDEKTYYSFLKNKGYMEEIYDYQEEAKIYYSIYDLDNDGTKELMIGVGSGDFRYNLFYTIEDNEVIYITKIYHYGNLLYNTKEKTIMYTDVRPSLAYGGGYSFYKLNNMTFENIRNVAEEINEGESKYYIYESDDDKMEISKEQYDKYFDNNVIINFERYA